MSCYNPCGYGCGYGCNPCGYNPCCNPCYRPCCFNYSITVNQPSTTSITYAPTFGGGSLTLTFSAPTNLWTGSGAYVTTITTGTSTATATTGSMAFAYNNACCPPTFTSTITASGTDVTLGNFSGTGTLTFGISGCSVTVSGSIPVTGSLSGTGTLTLSGSGCLTGCGNSKTLTITNVSLTGTLA